MSTTEAGRLAELAVARKLELEKHTIITLNWRTKWCEIDIISQHKKTIYFTEVKYRSDSKWGSGFEYITSRKIKQMKFAAELWIHENSWKGEVQLLGAEVTGDYDIAIITIFD